MKECPGKPLPHNTSVYPYRRGNLIEPVPVVLPEAAPIPEMPRNRILRVIQGVPEVGR